MYFETHIEKPVNYRKFRHIQVYSRHIQIYSTMLSHILNLVSYIFRTLSYSEFWHIKNPRYIQNSVKAYSGIFWTLYNTRKLRALPCSEFWLIYDLSHIYNSVYLGIFRHIQVCSTWLQWRQIQWSTEST